MRGWLLVGCVLAACGGGEGMMGDGGGGMGDDGTGTHGVMVTAHFVKGATPGVSNTFARPAARPVTANGTWLLSPNKVTAHITFINFGGADASTPGGGGSVSGCDVTFERGAPSASNLLDCAIEVPPGTYNRLNLQVRGQFEVVIDDPTNGFFSDPTQPGLLSTTMPSGGAQPITMSATTGLSQEQTFLEPLVIAEGETPPAISIALDALHTVTVNVSAGTPAIQDGAPLAIFPSIGGAPRAQFYTTSGTALSAYMEPPNAPSDIRVYDAPGGGQPQYVIISYAGTKGVPASCFDGAGPKAAYAADAAQFTPVMNQRPGGWLGRDATNKMCWILATDRTYTTSSAYLTMPEVNTIGATTSLTCETTATAAPPTSGHTYASGCPTTTASPATDAFTLAAQ